MSKVIKFLILIFILSFTVPVVSDYAGISNNSIYAQNTGDHHKKHKKSKKDDRKKTVHVKGYTTKKGKHVHSYWRRAPKRHH